MGSRKYLTTVAVREVLRVVTKVFVLETQRGHGDSEWPSAHGHRVCLNGNLARIGQSTIGRTEYALILFSFPMLLRKVGRKHWTFAEKRGFGAKLAFMTLHPQDSQQILKNFSCNAIVFIRHSWALA